MPTRSSIILALLTCLGVGHRANAEEPAYAAVRALGSGINLGNALDGPSEGEWGVTIKKEYFATIRQAGFQHVRLPVRWSAHAEKEAPYTIDETFFKRVDEVLDQALKAGLHVVLDLHHYDEMTADPDAHTDRLLALWKQIAERYRKLPPSVLYEPFNEPHDKLTPEKWNALFPKLLATIRRADPARIVVVGPGEWNGFRQLPNLKLPGGDRRLVVTVHYYEPFEFTHQGASWVDNADDWVGRTWTGSDEQKEQVTNALTTISRWSKANDRPIYIGEFGAFSKADMDSRVAWTKFVRSEFERLHFAWAYWEFASGFGAYDPEENAWRKPLLEALLPDSE